jgi:DNA-binding Lrp family transcriptional regulator
MLAPLDHIDEAILRELEEDSRLTADAVAARVGASSYECAVRIVELEKAGHIGGYTLVRDYPDPALRPVSAVIKVAQDPGRTGADLMRSLEYFPEIVTAEVLQADRSLLLRVQVTEPARIEAIASALRIQSAVVSVEVSMTTIVRSNVRSMASPRSMSSPSGSQAPGNGGI